MSPGPTRSSTRSGRRPLEQLQRLHLDQTTRALTIAVNLSGRQLSHTDLVESIDRHLTEHGVDPSCLVLEVTESVLLDDVASSSSALSGLKDLGLRLAVDDFGTGYSSLGYLKKFPFDMLKLDQAFTAGLGASAADDAIVFATAQMAHALGMLVVAEGVETQERHERARELGCDLAQGYLYAPPGTAEDVFGPARGLEAVP
jgi:EAL domain-containing protein (putative c-di-GMP-specific phosphodiesterase class I)